jgi:hypothetical protein
VNADVPGTDIFVQSLMRTIKEWPKSIYDIPAVIVAVQGELDRSPSSSSSKSSSAPDTIILMECLAELLV